MTDLPTVLHVSDPVILVPGVPGAPTDEPGATGLVEYHVTVQWPNWPTPSEMRYVGVPGSGEVWLRLTVKGYADDRAVAVPFALERGGPFGPDWFAQHFASTWTPANYRPGWPLKDDR